MKQKRGVIRASATKLLRAIEEETCTDVVNCDRLRELLSMLSVKETNLLELQRDIEEEMVVEVWIIRTTLTSGRLAQRG